MKLSPRTLQPGTYRNITGNSALAYGLVAASRRSGLPLFLGSYPITPASDILHELSKLKRFGVRTFQAEDEISGVGAALGASFGGGLGVTTTSGPGMCLKAETIGLAASVELPLIVCDIQRAGPSTGMPTKTEQADLLMALYGRNGESPVAVLAPATPSDCFDIAIEAVRIAVKYRTPVIILSDGYLANGSEPWRIPAVDSLAKLRDEFSFAIPDEGPAPTARPASCRSSGTRRPWPGPGLSREPPGWSTGSAGSRRPTAPGRSPMIPITTTRWSGCARPRSTGSRPISRRSRWTTRTARPGPGARLGLDLRIHRRRGPPGPAGRGRGRPGASAPPVPVPGQPRRRAAPLRQGAVPEINLGQLALLLRGRYLVDVISYNRVRGLPFRAAELAGVIQDVIANV